MSNLDKSIQSEIGLANTAGLDSPLLIVRDAQGKQVIALQSGQALSFAAVQGEHYRLLSNMENGEEHLLDNLIAVRQGPDLVISYALGVQLSIDGYFDLCVPKFPDQPDSLQCSATVAGDSEAGHVIQSATNGAGVSASDPAIVYTHGEEQELLALVNGNAADELLLTNFLTSIVQPAAAGFALPGLLGGLGGALAVAGAAGGGG